LFDIERPHDHLDDFALEAMEMLHYAHRRPCPKQDDSEKRVSGRAGSTATSFTLSG
jgi:hypothetical protein